MNKTMKSLVKNTGTQLYTQDDITSLSLNPHFAKPTTSGVVEDDELNNNSKQNLSTAEKSE